MAQSTTVEGAQGAEPQRGTRPLLVWDPRIGPGFILAVIALVIGFAWFAPDVDRRIGRLEEGQREMRENQERIIEKMDEVLEAVGER